MASKGGKKEKRMRENRSAFAFENSPGLVGEILSAVERQPPAKVWALKYVPSIKVSGPLSVGLA